MQEIQNRCAEQEEIKNDLQTKIDDLTREVAAKEQRIE